MVSSDPVTDARQHRKEAVAQCIHIDIVAINMSEDFLMVLESVDGVGIVIHGIYQN